MSKWMFDGKCQDCHLGRYVEDHIHCEVRGIRDALQTCNILKRPAMTSDKDWEKVEKGTVKKLAVRYLDPNGAGIALFLQDLDALKPIAECEDAVSRKAMIKEWRAAVKRVYGRPYVDSDQLVLSVMKNLPSVLPASNERSASVTKRRPGGRTSVRSEAEIRAAIDYLEDEAKRLEGAGAAVEMISHCDVADLVRLLFGIKPKEEFWDETKLFAPSGKPRKEETGGS